MALINRCVVSAILYAALLCGAVATRAAPTADVSVQIGPTSIPKGNATGARDITLRNGRLAVAFAVETAPPWGVARGGIIDAAVVRNGVIDADRASLVDFMPNNWSSWPTTYQRVTVEKNTPQEAVIRSERDWGTMALVTRFTLKAGDDRIHILTRMSNRGDSRSDELLSGYVMWPAGGYLFGVPGTQGRAKGKITESLAHWSAAYDADWFMGLHAPFADQFDDDSRDRYMSHALDKGESREFQAWLQIGPKGELAPLVKAEIEQQGLAFGRISGHITTTAGTAVEKPAVIVEQQTPTGVHPYTWTIGEAGSYELMLPVGRYVVYAGASAHANSSRVALDVSAHGDLKQDFTDLQPPGSLAIQVQASNGGAPLDARITIEQGDKPLIKYFGRSTFFTELTPAGQSAMQLAPGPYRFKVAVAEGFRARAGFYDIDIAAGGSQTLIASIALLADPAARGWYGGDLHHHSDVLDGFTDPEFVLRSELAAGLDLMFLSDHDSVINNRAMSEMSGRRGVPFIPATELSPSWAHFNAYPLDAGASLDIDPGRSTVQQIFAEARRMGADVIQVNHPFINYGYFLSQDTNAIPGGYSEAFDLVEIGAGEDNPRIAERAWQLWNAGQRAYLAAGSDVHDVWRDVSGSVRMYVKVDGELSVKSFVHALKSGHAYASQGPLIYPQVMFGETLHQRAGTPLALDFSIQAVSGLKSVTLVERGKRGETRYFDASGDQVALGDLLPVGFVVKPGANTWYALVVEDAKGGFAYTNPIWVEVQ